MPKLTALPKKHKQAIIYILTATLIWGAAGPVIKYTLNFIPPFTFLFLRFLVASAIILPFLILEQERKPIEKKDWPNLIILSFLGGTLTLVFTFLGFKYTTALDGSLISSVGAVFVLWASNKFLGEKISKNERRGITYATLGTLVVVLHPFWESGIQNALEPRNISHIIGNGFMLLSILAWTAYTLWSKKVLDHIPSKMGFIFHALHLRSSMNQYSPFFLTGVLCVVSLITLAPMAFLEIASIKGVRIPNLEVVGQNIRETYQLPSIESEFLIPMAGVFYMGIFSTLVAYGLYEWALKDMPVAESAIYGYLAPLFGIPVGYVLLGELPGFWYIIGGIIIAYGVYVSEKKA